MSEVVKIESIWQTTGEKPTKGEKVEKLKTTKISPSNIAKETSSYPPLDQRPPEVVQEA